MALSSHDHIEIILNGHEITGYADEDPPYMLEFTQSTEHRTGHHGNVYALTKPIRTATLRVKLAPHSPSVQWFIQRYNERIQRDIDRLEGPFFEGSISDVSKNNSWSLNGGFIINVPGFTAPFQTYEAELFFETVIPNVDGGRFYQRLQDQADERG